MKKNLFILLAFLLLIFSCSKNEGGNSSSSSKDKDEIYEINWISIGPQQNDTDKVIQKLNEYLSSKISVNLKYTSYNFGEYDQKIMLDLISGEKVDLVFSASWANNYTMNSKKGLFTDITEYVQNNQELKNIINDDMWNAIKVNGRIYGVPNYKDLARQDYIILNKAIVDKYNLDISSLYESETNNPTEVYRKLVPLFEQITDEGNDFTYFVWHKNSKPSFMVDYIIGDQYPFAVQVETDKPEVFSIFDYPNFREFVALAKEMKDNGYINEEAAFTRDSEGFANPKNKNWFSRSAQGFPGSEIDWAKLYNMDIIAIPIAKPVMSKSSLLGSILAIPSSSKNPKKVMDFITLLNTDVYVRNTMAYGIEGFHYEKVSDNVIKPKEGWGNYDVPNFALGSLLNVYVPEGGDTESRKKLKAFNDSAIVSPVSKLTFDVEKYQSELALIKNIFIQYAPILITGSFEKTLEETFDEVNEKLEEANASQIIEYYNQIINSN